MQGENTQGSESQGSKTQGDGIAEPGRPRPPRAARPDNHYQVFFSVTTPTGTEDGEVEYTGPGIHTARSMITDKMVEFAEGELVLDFEVKEIVEWKHPTFDDLEWAVACVRNALNRREARNKDKSGSGDDLLTSHQITLNTVIDAMKNGALFPKEWSP